MYKKKLGIKFKTVGFQVIASMTVGKDVSALFPDVVNCMQTDNLELKKLVYLYLMNYAKSQPDMAIMAVNTFVKVSYNLLNPECLLHFWNTNFYLYFYCKDLPTSQLVKVNLLQVVSFLMISYAFETSQNTQWSSYKSPQIVENNMLLFTLT